ncbi:hypothetical protein SAMN06269185_1161 [Natronoarchaeum philippinense]|uniref:Uncharacterized protein n=1 Tax=Natronoarchaeum philippinense TaxID=558529 RepID=A0A285NAB1_NATPI|nr:DUF5781 family protein [Natronoarchaeum philippinense]SNZ06412.1 hypothetical protein SAMN06269185_1161 [Natronoarchaeum philippinense]
MELHVQGTGPAAPFLSARDLFETEHDLALPVTVRIRENPDERTWTGHTDDEHVLNISRQAATGAMARELAVHEFAHMLRNEEEHPSHVQSTEEALFLALAGESVERHTLTQCYQIANHMKDIYADDITLSLGPSDKLVSFFESQLASALADRPDAAGDATAWGLFGGRHVERSSTPDSRRITAATDPEITAVNAAFALAMVERHDLASSDHRLYDLAHAAARDAPAIDSEAFKRRFKNLQRDPDPSDYRKALVDATRAFAAGSGRAAD